MRTFVRTGSRWRGSFFSFFGRCARGGFLLPRSAGFVLYARANGATCNFKAFNFLFNEKAVELNLLKLISLLKMLKVHTKSGQILEGEVFAVDPVTSTVILSSMICIFKV